VSKSSPPRVARPVFQPIEIVKYAQNISVTK